VSVWLLPFGDLKLFDIWCLKFGMSRSPFFYVEERAFLCVIQKNKILGFKLCALASLRESMFFD